MAKGNLFQGMGRGKVGDVVFSRLNGEQIARVRNRNPKNPKTNKQLYQRAVMATVMQAYSAGIVILDHSFQGKEVGAANQRRFLSLNAKSLRAAIAADLADLSANQNGRVVAPGISAPVPAMFQVSEGSLINTLLPGNIPATANSNEKVGEYCSRLGLVAGDLFTFVAYVVPQNADVLFQVNGVTADGGKHLSTSFMFARYAVKTAALTSTEAYTNLSQVLELTDSNFTPIINFGSLASETPVSIENMVNANATGTYGWIRSRKNEDLRSNCTLAFETRAFGIESKYALQAWTQGTADLGDSDLILEGGDI